MVNCDRRIQDGVNIFFWEMTVKLLLFLPPIIIVEAKCTYMMELVHEQSHL